MKFFENIEEEIAFGNIIKKLRCCDEVSISIDDCLALEKIFKINGNGYCKSDLIIGSMVPLQNIKIVLNGILESKDNYSIPVDAEVYIFDGYDLNFPGYYLNVGAIKFSEDFYVVLSVSNEENYISHGEYGFIFEDQKSYNDVCSGFWSIVDNFNSHDEFDAFMSNLIGVVLRAWYIIQISLLNPITKDIFQHPTISKDVNCKTASKHKRKKAVKYVRKHIVSAEKISEIIEHYNISNHTKKKFTCPAWYVCGHYRNYPSGKKVFIKPYWKGEMREKYYEANGICRSRIIAQLD